MIRLKLSAHLLRNSLASCQGITQGRDPSTPQSPRCAEELLRSG